jgi:hypothetical protein
MNTFETLHRSAQRVIGVLGEYCARFARLDEEVPEHGPASIGALTLQHQVESPRTATLRELYAQQAQWGQWQ